MKPIISLLPKIKLLVLCYWGWFLLSSVIYGLICWYAINSLHERIAYLTIGVIINFLIAFLLSIINLNRMAIRMLYCIKEERYSLKSFYWWYQLLIILVLFFIIIWAMQMTSVKINYTSILADKWWIALCYCIWYILINLSFILILFRLFNDKKNI